MTHAHAISVRLTTRQPRKLTRQTWVWTCLNMLRILWSTAFEVHLLLLRLIPDANRSPFPLLFFGLDCPVPFKTGLMLLWSSWETVTEIYHAEGQEQSNQPQYCEGHLPSFITLGTEHCPHHRDYVSISLHECCFPAAYVDTPLSSEFPIVNPHSF